MPADDDPTVLGHPWDRLLADLHHWGSPNGAPEGPQNLSSLPDMSSSAALYDFGATLSVAVSDLANALVLLAHNPPGTRPPPTPQPLQPSAEPGNNPGLPSSPLAPLALGHLPGWMLADHAEFDQALRQLDERLAQWPQWCVQVAQALGHTSSDTAAEQVNHYLRHHLGPALALGEALHQVRQAIAELSQLHQHWQPHLVQWQQQRGSNSPTGHRPARRGLARAQITPAPHPAEHERAHAVEQMRLAELNLRHQVQQATRALPMPTDPSEQVWLPGFDTAEVAKLRHLLTRALPSTAAQVRAALGADLDSQAVHHLMVSNPAISTLVAKQRQPHDLPPDLDAALKGHPSGPITDQRWMVGALLWPAVVGPHPTAPLNVRVQANHLLVRAALVRSRSTYQGIERLILARLNPAHGLRLASRVQVWLRTAWQRRERRSSLWALPGQLPSIAREDLRGRIRHYEAMLHQPGPVVPGTDGWPRQLLQFDARGSGRTVELCGRLDEHTRNLVILVPGTGTTAKGFHMPAGFAADVVRADASGHTAAIAWMGADFPQGFANQSPLARYASLAAPPLCDFVEGLPIPPGCRLTLVGHSYGGVIVGAAERLGVRADRVIHAASAGSGPGVSSVADYASHDRHGNPRQVRRYCLSVPGDLVGWAHTAHRLVLRLPAGWARRISAALHMVNLGIDPRDLVGVTHLDTGVWEQAVGPHPQGQRLYGPAGHSSVTTPGTTAFAEIMRVVTGQRDH